MPEKITVTNVFKDTADKSLNDLWVEIINHLEAVRYEVKLEESEEISYSTDIQSRSCQSKNGEAGHSPNGELLAHAAGVNDI